MHIIKFKSAEIFKMALLIHQSIVSCKPALKTNLSYKDTRLDLVGHYFSRLVDPPGPSRKDRHYFHLQGTSLKQNTLQCFKNTLQCFVRPGGSQKWHDLRVMVSGKKNYISVFMGQLSIEVKGC